MKDVIIVGGGAAGLLAAKMLSAKGKKVLLLEAKDILGGRIHTNENTFSSPAEGGAEFIHGNLYLTKKLLKQAGLAFTKVRGNMYNFKKGNFFTEENGVDGWDLLIKRLKKLKEDITVKQFLDKYLPGEEYNEIKEAFKNYVQGYDAADTNLASAISIREEMKARAVSYTHLTLPTT